MANDAGILSDHFRSFFSGESAKLVKLTVKLRGWNFQVPNSRSDSHDHSHGLCTFKIPYSGYFSGEIFLMKIEI